MNFNDFFNAIQDIVVVDLPSKSAHVKMAPLERVKLIEEGFYNLDNTRKAAVMMLFYPKNEITHLVLILRNSYSGVHSSQIAFPGGKVETEDESLAHTALRETHEEIGIPPDQIKVIKAFTEIYIPPSNFMVSPFLGISHDELNFTEQIEEVAGIIELPLTDLLKDETVVIRQKNTSYGENIDVPSFKIDEHYVWGATAMMLSELKEVLKKVL